MSKTAQVNQDDDLMSKIIKKLEEHDQRFNVIEQKFSEHDKKSDRITQKLLDHDDQFAWVKENMSTKTDIRGIATTLDDLVGLYRKTDQEQIFMGQRVNRLEDDVKQIKPLVGL